MVTNDELQEELQKFADGEKISIELAKHFYNQNDGYMVKAEDDEYAMGFVPKINRLLIDVIEVDEDNQGVIDEERSFAIPVSTKTSQELINEIRVGTKSKFSVDLSERDSKPEDPDNQDNMYA